MNVISLLKNAPSPLTLLDSTLKAARSVGYQWRHGGLHYPGFVEQAAVTFGHRVLIKYGDQRITYREFNERCNQIAHYLKANGLGMGDVIALFMENRPEYLLYLTAITKLGATAALVNNAQQGSVLAHSLNLVAARAVIVGDEVSGPLQSVLDRLDHPPLVFTVPDNDGERTCSELVCEFANIQSLSRGYPTYNLEETRLIKPDSPCFYIYTSGTTGLPKASVQRHKRLLGLALGLGMFSGAVKRDDTVYSTLPLYHATALFFSWLSVLANGASLAIRRKFSASEFWQDIVRYDATVFVYVGELCRYLLNQPESPWDRQHRVRMITGNGLRPELWKAFKTRFNIAEVREFYGSSEGNVACYNLFNQDCTMGMVLGSYAIVKIDTETEEPVKNADGFLVKCAPGEAGLLLGRITKVTPFDGYTDPAKNASKIFRDVFRRGDAWFNTGDLVKDQGLRHLQFVDRLGDTFRWKGENVSTGQVEMIVNEFPGISESIAYGVEMPGTNGRAGMVALVLSDADAGVGVELTALHQHLLRALPAFAIPVFVRTLSAVNSTGTFKYQRTHLKMQAYYPQRFDNTLDRLFVALPGEPGYQEATAAIIEKIDAGGYRF